MGFTTKLLALATLAALLLPSRAGVIKLLQDFEADVPPLATGHAAITTARSRETEFGQACLKLTVAQGFAWRRPGAPGQQVAPLDAVRVALLAGPYLPPEADAIRLRVRVAAGGAIIAVGGPVSQIGNSDVFCDPQWVDATRGPGWQTLELSLNQRVVRNFRRPNFTTELPVVYYTRWAQEPLGLYVVAVPAARRAAADTVLFVDQVELLSRGEGRPFPVFDPASLEVVATIADFTAATDRAKVVAVAHGYSLLPSFEAGYRRPAASPGPPLPEHVRQSSPFIREEGIPYPAPRCTLVPGRAGGAALRAECVWAEEGQIVTVKAPGTAQANALAFAIKPDLPATATGPYALTHGGGPANAVDVLVFVAAPDAAFPWHDLAPSEELVQALRASGYQGPGACYDALLTTDPKARCLRVPDLQHAGAFGFYAARRYVPAGGWANVVIPFADFVCVYGQGACQALQRGQRPLPPQQIAAVGFLAPFGSRHGTLTLDDLQYVRVKGDLAALRSFWQVPEATKVRLIPLPHYAQYRSWVMMTLGEDAPPFLLPPRNELH